MIHFWTYKLGVKMRIKLLILALTLSISQSSHAGDVGSLSIRTLKIFSNSSLLHQRLGWLGIEEMEHLDKNHDYPNTPGTRYRLSLGRQDLPQDKKCIIVTLGNNEDISDIKECDHR